MENMFFLSNCHFLKNSISKNHQMTKSLAYLPISFLFVKFAIFIGKPLTYSKNEIEININKKNEKQE